MQPFSDAWSLPSRRGLLKLLGSAALLGGASDLGRAQDTPSIKVVIAFPPGGTSTASMTPLREPMRATLGMPVTLEYKPGAGGNVAALAVVQAVPDGRTLLFGHAGPLAINHHIMVQSVFDPQRDLVPLALIVQFPIVISIAAKYHVATLAELIAL